MLAALVLAVALLALVATGPQAAEAAGRYKTVTKTFSSTQVISIVNQFGVGHATTPYPSETNAAGFRRGKILDANLTLTGFGHREPNGVDVMLSHGVANRTVMSDVGYTYPVSDLTFLLDDETASPLPHLDRLTSGTFDPTNNGADDSLPTPAPAPSGLADSPGSTA